MGKPTGDMYAANAVDLPNKNIPYVANGSTLKGMDCQGLMEYLLQKVGISKNWAGSNAMWRDMAWTGTPEECVRQFGCVPIGAWLFIWEETGAPAKYKDGLGNANHVGVKTASGNAVHASASRGCVANSVFKDKTIRNGGWNRVGLPNFLDFGIVYSENAPLGSASKATPVFTAVDVSGFYTVKKSCLGGSVRKLQTWLMDIGYNVGASGSDGEFGNNTLAAVMQFQTDYGLEADGIVGQKTWAALAEARAEAMNTASNS